MLSGLTELGEWLLQHFGQLNAVLIVVCGYFAWMHRKEIEAHRVTQKYIIDMQEKFLTAQVNVTAVLVELKELIRQEVSGSESGSGSCYEDEEVN